MTKYDPEVIFMFADRLYASARNVVLMFTAFGGLVGFAVGYLMAEFIGGIILAAILAVIGRWFGNEKAFQLKLQAQTSLCQVEIEKNTRADGAAG